jgi:hypothetical protein
MSMAIEQSIACGSSAMTKVKDGVPASKWPFGVLLLGLAAALVLLGAIFPDFFCGDLGPHMP